MSSETWMTLNIVGTVAILAAGILLILIVGRNSYDQTRKFASLKSGS